MQGYLSYKIIDSTFEPIHDASTIYRLDRYGGKIIFYQINCKQCSTKLFIYQKDGDGPLLRCYHDRIRETFPEYNLTNNLEIQCKKCSTIISNPMSKYSKTYKTHHEERDAYIISHI